jgi:hypothetical protein
MIQTVKKLGFLLLACLLFVVPAHADKITVGTYHTKENQDKVFADTMRVLTQLRYAVKFTDKAQGAIQANKTSFDVGAEYATVFITIIKDGDGASIVATFTKRGGFVTLRGGGPDKWATLFGDELKKDLPDITADIKKH